MRTLPALLTDSKSRVAVPVMQLRPYAPNASPIAKTVRQSVFGSELQPYIAGLEKQEKDLESRRDLDQLEFQNADQKYNQFMNTLLSVLKTMNELRSTLTHNMR